MAGAERVSKRTGRSDAEWQSQERFGLLGIAIWVHYPGRLVWPLVSWRESIICWMHPSV